MVDAGRSPWGWRVICASDLPGLPPPRLTAFSFGGGVQSTTILALLKNRPSLFTDAGLALPTIAVFSDTGAEKPAVLEHISRLESWGLPLELRTVRNHKNGSHPDQIGRPPWFTLAPDGHRGQTVRSCTEKWKARPLEREYRNAAGFKRGTHAPAGAIHIWLGISTDEASRAGMSQKKHIVQLYPLLEIGWSRAMCQEYLAEAFPWPVPKSACTFCPFTNPREWDRVEREDPSHWSAAVAADESLRGPGSKVGATLNGACFIHPLRIPLPEAVRMWRMAHLPQYRGETPLFDFDAMEQECSGLCGV